MAPKFLLLTSLISTFLLISSTGGSFTPLDNYLLNCGSAAAAGTIVVDNRRFVEDSPFLSQGKKSFPVQIRIRNPSRSSNYSAIYATARVFTSASSYVFRIKTVGTHVLRFHFSPFDSGNYNLSFGEFHVSANGDSLLTRFTVNDTVVKEFFLNLDKEELEVTLIPANYSTFAYVNAIEVFSAPKDFFIDAGGIALVTPDGIEEFKQNVSNQVLETVHRINVGGPKLTPFNDTLWRTWIPDEDFLVLKSAAKVATTTDPPNYQQGGATRETAPDNVYMTAQEMNIANRSLNLLFNITWNFPVRRSDTMHFVRLHFCDIVSVAIYTLYFNIYINNITAYKDFDLSVLSFHQLASPYYIDFVVRSPKNLDNVMISVGPSELSTTSRKNAILNGVEIMRMVNFAASAKMPSKKDRKWIVAGSIVGGILFLGFALVGIFTVCKFGKKKAKPSPRRRRADSAAGWTSLRVLTGSSQATVTEGAVLASPGPYGYHGLKIPFSDIQSATNSFDKNLIIGSGGFGMVYKGILNSNVKVAVKRGVPGSRQGVPEFQTEITVLSKIRHRHLVSLVGYCEEQSEMLLVYEYMEKGPLRHHLYGSDLPSLSWKQRLEICIGAARGLHYLHTGSAQGMIIHRDIKSTNILLDENYVAKVADFGLSKSGPCLDETHVSTGVKGSFGYLDPEYFRRQQLTEKSDVYSFGVVLFEVLCARPAVDPLLDREQVNLAEWAMEWQKKGIIGEVVDRRLADVIKPVALKKFGETAEKCLAEYGVDRPTMGDVLWNLEYVYQLQFSEREINGSGSDGDGGGAVTVPVPVAEGCSSDDGASDISTTRVFSQLMKSEGR